MDLSNIDPSKLPPEKLKKLVKLNDKYKEAYGQGFLPEKDEGAIASSLRGAATVMDYLRGVPAAAVGAMIPGATTEGTLGRVFRGEQLGPSYDELLEKAGVGEGGALSDVLPGMYSDTGEGMLTLQKGGVLDPTARGAAGFALDIALDPATYLGAPVAKLAKETSIARKKLIEKLGEESSEGLVKRLSSPQAMAAVKNALAQTADAVINPFEKLMRGAGRTAIKAPFLAADSELASKGAKPLSEYAWEKEIFGTRRGMENKFVKEYGENIAARDAVLDSISHPIDYDKAFGKADEIAGKLRTAGEKDAADAINAMAMQYKEAGQLAQAKGAGPQIAQYQKQLLSEKLPDSAYGAAGRARGPINQARKAMAGGLSDEIGSAAAKSIEGGDVALKQANKNLQTLLGSRKVRERVAKVEGRRPRMTQLEKYTTLGAAIGSDNPGKGAAYYGAKKLFDLLGGPAVSSGSAIGLKKASEAPLINKILKRVYIDQEQEKQSPWTLLPRE